MVKKKARLYKLDKKDFNRICEEVPELKEEIRKSADKRIDDLYSRTSEDSNITWREKTLECLQQNHLAVTFDDLQIEGQHASAGSSAAMAIWFGILIDGIPESLIIGILALDPNGVSLAFIAGVFLANFPEAMSSAVSMENSGMKYKRILMMWGSLCLVTGIGAAIGASLFPAQPTGISFYFFLGIEGLAAGAMLTMIAETMLPEAFEQGGSIVGISTLLGFLAALSVKVLT